MTGVKTFFHPKYYLRKWHSDALLRPTTIGEHTAAVDEELTILRKSLVRQWQSLRVT